MILSSLQLYLKPKHLYRSSLRLIRLQKRTLKFTSHFDKLTKDLPIKISSSGNNGKYIDSFFFFLL
jgi:hypothetical protein